MLGMSLDQCPPAAKGGIVEPDARALSWQQAYEATYRFIVRYYEHERLKPILRLLQSTYGGPRLGTRGVAGTTGVDGMGGVCSRDPRRITAPEDSSTVGVRRHRWYSRVGSG